MGKPVNVTIGDLETGGFEYKEKQITEVAFINFDLETFKVNWEFQTFVKPYADLEIDPIVYEKTMVTEKDVQNGMEAKQLVKELIALFKGSNYMGSHAAGRTALGGHNFLGFDREFMEHLFALHNKNLYDFVAKKMHDTLPMAEQCWVGDGGKMNLGACCKRIGYDLRGAHGALADTRANFELYKYLTLRMRGNSGMTIQGGVEKPIKQHRKFFQF